MNADTLIGNCKRSLLLNEVDFLGMMHGIQIYLSISTNPIRKGLPLGKL